MESLPVVWIIAAVVIGLVAVRIMFKVAGFFLKLLVLAAACIAIWFLVTGGS